MALYNEQPYHYVMLAMTFHPLAYLQEWKFPLFIDFEKTLLVIYLEQIMFSQETLFHLGAILTMQVNLGEYFRIVSTSCFGSLDCVALHNTNSLLLTLDLVDHLA
jgi:hypothetical protein